jgi:hypothetical protein
MCEHQRGQEGVEIGEMAVQYPLGELRLGRDRSAGQPVWPVAEQDPLGGAE